MRVFSVPVSVPLLRTVIAALVDGRLVEGFEARSNPLNLARATLYLPTRRAGRLAREIFLDELKTDAAILPRIVALGDIDEDELAFAEGSEQFSGVAPLDVPPRLGELERRLTLAHLVAAWAKSPVLGAARGRRPGLDTGAGRRSGAADGRHGDARRCLGSARQTGARPVRQILAALAGIFAHRAQDMAGASEGDRPDRTRRAARPPDRCRSRAADRAS